MLNRKHELSALQKNKIKKNASHRSTFIVDWCQEQNARHHSGFSEERMRMRRALKTKGGNVQQWHIIKAGKTHLNAIIIGCKRLEKLRGLNCFYNSMLTVARSL